MRLECINCPGSGCNFLSKPGSDLAHPPPLEFWKLHRKKAELITKIILRETLFHHLPIRPQQSHRDCVKALIEPSFKWPLKLKTVPSEVSKLRKFLRSFGARVIAVRELDPEEQVCEKNSSLAHDDFRPIKITARKRGYYGRTRPSTFAEKRSTLFRKYQNLTNSTVFSRTCSIHKINLLLVQIFGVLHRGTTITGDGNRIVPTRLSV
jgi:hypothetical protein